MSRIKTQENQTLPPCTHFKHQSLPLPIVKISPIRSKKKKTSLMVQMNYNPNFNISQSPSISYGDTHLSTSNISTQAENIEKTPHFSTNNTICDKSFSESLLIIEQKYEDLFEKKKQSGLSEALFKEAQILFLELISTDSCFRGVLKGLKDLYEEWIQNHSKKIEGLSNKNLEFIELSEKYNRTLQENQSMQKRIQEVFKENIMIGNKNQLLEEKIKVLQDYLKEISGACVKEHPDRDLDWKVILCKNKKYLERIEKLEEKVKFYKENLKMSLTLFASLNKLGFPVRSLHKKFLEESQLIENSVISEAENAEKKLKIKNEVFLADFWEKEDKN